MSSIYNKCCKIWSLLKEETEEYIPGFFLLHKMKKSKSTNDMVLIYILCVTTVSCYEIENTEKTENKLHVGYRE